VAISVSGRLRRADIANALQKIVEVVSLTRPWRVLQALVVHDEALLDELFEQLDRPPSELRSSVTAHPEAHREDGGQRVVQHLPGDGATPLGSNH
jgi:hypothetical protein